MVGVNGLRRWEVHGFNEQTTDGVEKYLPELEVQEESSTHDTSGGPAGLLFSKRLELPELELSRRFLLERTAEAFAARYLWKGAMGAGPGPVFRDSIARLRYRSSIARSRQQEQEARSTTRERWRNKNRPTIQGPSAAIYTSTPNSACTWAEDKEITLVLGSGSVMVVRHQEPDDGYIP